MGRVFQGLGVLIAISALFVIFVFLDASLEFGEPRYRPEVIGSIKDPIGFTDFEDSSPANQKEICSTISEGLHWQYWRLSHAALSQSLALNRASIDIATDRRWREKDQLEKISIGLFGVSGDELAAAHKAISDSRHLVKDGNRLADFIIACGGWAEK